MRLKFTGERCCRKAKVDTRYQHAFKTPCGIFAVEVIEGRHYCAGHARRRKQEIARRDKK